MLDWAQDLILTSCEYLIETISTAHLPTQKPQHALFQSAEHPLFGKLYGFPLNKPHVQASDTYLHLLPIHKYSAL